MEHLPLVGGNAWTTLVGAAVVRWLGGVEAKRDEPAPAVLAEAVESEPPLLAAVEMSPTGQ